MEKICNYINRIQQKIDIQKSDNKRDNIKNIVSDISRLIKRKSIIPVICEDMFEYENPQTKERQPLHAYIIEKILDNYQGRLQLTEAEFNGILSDNYYAISILKEKIGRELYYDIFSSVVDEDNNLCEGVCLKKDVASFLKVCKFPLIVTTNCFAVIENELGNEYKSYWAKPGIKNDQPLPEKCVYHILGEAEAESSNWGCSDKQVLRFLISYYSDYPLKNLTEIIESNYSHKTLLFLGNQAPDWLFRFLLNPIYGGDIYDDSKGFYMSNKIEDSLNLFLRDIKFEKEEQMTTVIKQVVEKQSLDSLHLHCTVSNEYDFFVAHASEDTTRARCLVEYLRNKGKTVWFDENETKKGGEYWKRIILGLQESKYFMPFITENYITKLRDAKSREEAFIKCSIPGICFDAEKLASLDDELPGIVVELALAEEIMKKEKKDNTIYSLPIIVEGASFYATPITQSFLEALSKDSNYLPQNLFYGMQMYTFDSDSHAIKDLNIADF